MEREEFNQRKSKILKVVAVSLIVVVCIAGILGFIYMRFGIAGLIQNPIATSLFGLDKQKDLDTPDMTREEKSKINDAIGYNLETLDRASLTSTRNLELTVSPQGMVYLMNALIKNKETFQNLQIAANQEGKLEISAVADVGLICDIIGQDKALIESSVGPLPDKVALYTALNPDHQADGTTIESIMIGQVQVPSSLYSSINAGVDDGLDLFFSEALGIDLDYLSVEGQKITLKGSFPAP